MVFAQQLLFIAVLLIVIYRLIRSDKAPVAKSRYDGASLYILSEEYRKYSFEMGVWTRILLEDIECISLLPPDRRPAKTHITSPEMILQMKRLAADRINAIEDVLGEIQRETAKHGSINASVSREAMPQ